MGYWAKRMAVVPVDCTSYTYVSSSQDSVAICTTHRCLTFKAYPPWFHCCLHCSDQCEIMWIQEVDKHIHAKQESYFSFASASVWLAIIQVVPTQQSDCSTRNLERAQISMTAHLTHYGNIVTFRAGVGNGGKIGYKMNRFIVQFDLFSCLSLDEWLEEDENQQKRKDLCLCHMKSSINCPGMNKLRPNQCLGLSDVFGSIWKAPNRM